MATHTITTGDIILCDVNATLSSPTLTYTTMFNFHPGEDVQKNIDKQVYVIKRPGAPSGYEIGLGERMFTITTTIKAADTSKRSLADLNSLSLSQYSVVYSGRPSNGVIQFYYYGDKVQATLYPVIVKSFWYEQRPGGGTMFDLRVALSEVRMP